MTISAACGGTKKAKLTTFDLETAPQALTVGKSVQLMPNMKFEGRQPTPLPRPQWSSSAPAVATVNADGVATGVSPGTVTITASYSGQSASKMIVVSAEKILNRLAIEPDTATYPAGATVPLIARGFYSDMTDADVTKEVEWSSSDTAVARVGNDSETAKGLLGTLSPGMTTITVKKGDITADKVLTISGAKVKTLSVTPVRTTAAVGATEDFVATATLDDDSTLNVTTMAIWMSSDTKIATIAGGRATGVAAGAVDITATWQGTSSLPAKLTVTNVAARSLAVTPATPTLGIGASQQMTATVTFVDNTTDDVTNAAIWSSSAPGVATVDENGLVKAVSKGTTTVRAVFGRVMGETVVTVTDAQIVSIEVLPATQSVPRGLTQMYSATALYTDGVRRVVTNDATWMVVDASIASISNTAGTKGLLRGERQGTTMVTASFGDKVGSAMVTVSDAELRELAISPSNQVVAVKGRVAYQARGLFSDGSNRFVTTEVTWSSDARDVADISNANGSRGVVIASKAGSTVIRATLRGVTQSTALTVTSATLSSITISPVTKTIAKRTSTRLVATGIYSDLTHADITELADWTSANEAIATASSAAGSRGRVTGVAAGSTTITAAFDGKSIGAVVRVTDATLSTLSISPTNRRVAKESIVDFRAAGVFSDDTTQDLTDQVMWSSSNPAFATISNEGPTWGRASTLAAGTTAISAKFDAVTASTDLIVTDATLTALSISPASSRIAATTTIQLTATGTYSDMTSQDLSETVFWRSSKPEFATVSIAVGRGGRVTGVAAGSATISATLGARTANATVEVTNATLSSIAVSPQTATIPFLTEQQFTATGTFSDGTTQGLTNQVTWTSSDTSKAVVYNDDGNEGKAAGIDAGTVTIRASIGAVSGTATLIVTSSPLATITVSPATRSIAKGTTQQFTATGTFEDGSTRPLTALVTWSATNAGAGTVASISNNAADRGLASGLVPGSATIRATLGTVSGTATLTVTDATLVSISVMPETKSIAKGTKQQYAVTGTFSDGLTQTLTSSASWQVDNAVASITASGEATGENVGTATIRATVDGKSDTATLTVTNATLSSLQILQGNPSVAKGVTVNYQLRGVYTDGSTQMVTADATWTSSNAAAVELTGQGTATVAARAVLEGMHTITARIGTITATSIMTVTPATLVSIAVTPATKTLPKGATQQYTAIGTYSDNSTADLTESANWSASNNKATVDITAGSRGFVTAAPSAVIPVGDVEIIATVTSGGMTYMDSATLTVTDAVLKALAISADISPAPRGVTVTYTATGTLTNNITQNLTNSVAWSSSDTNIATITNGPMGKVLAKNVGMATIRAVATATPMNFEATHVLQVTAATVASVTVTGPNNHKIAINTKSQLIATARYTDFPDTPDVNVTTQATWNATPVGASPMNTATFAANDGIVQGNAVGNVTVGAQYAGFTGTFALEVTNAQITSMAVTPSTPTVASLNTQQFFATGTFSDGTTQPLNLQADWSSSNTAAGTISNDPTSRGLFTGASTTIQRTTNVSAIWSGVSGSTTATVTPVALVRIEVTPPNTVINVGISQRYTATGVYSDNSTADLSSSPDLSWTTDPVSVNVADISNLPMTPGVARGNGSGLVHVVATWSSGGNTVSGRAQLVVRNSPVGSVTIAPAPSSNPPTPLVRPLGVAQPFVASAVVNGVMTDVTSQVTWATGDSSIAEVDTSGVVVGVTANMSTTVVAVYSGVVSNVVNFSVSNATLQSIAVTPANTSVAKGVQVAYTAMGTFSDGQVVDLTNTATWTSTNGSVTVSNTGVATTANYTTGAVTIRATQNGVTGETGLTITGAVLQSITVAPDPADPGTSITQAQTKQWRATGNFSDGTTANLTDQVTWTSSNGSVATVSNAAPRGLATPTPMGQGGVTGMTTISAIHSTGITGTATLTVTP